MAFPYLLGHRIMRSVAAFLVDCRHLKEQPCPLARGLVSCLCGFLKPVVVRLIPEPAHPDKGQWKRTWMGHYRELCTYRNDKNDVNGRDLVTFSATELSPKQPCAQWLPKWRTDLIVQRRLEMYRMHIQRRRYDIAQS